MLPAAAAIAVTRRAMREFLRLAHAWTGCNICAMSEPTDNRADPFRKAPTEAARVMADAPEPAVSFPVDPPGMTPEYRSFRGRRGPAGDRARALPARPDREAIVLQLDRDGMFTNVNRVIDSVFIAKTFRRDFHVRWDNSLYQDPGCGDENTWEKYFDQPFPDCKRSDDPVAFDSLFARRLWYAESMTQPLFNDRNGKRRIMGLPGDRLRAAGLIGDHLHLRPELQERVDRFVQSRLDGPTIGLHIRGLGRNAGGTAEMRYFLDDDPDLIPFRTYFALVDRALEKYPNARILACSDSSSVIDACRLHYGDRLITHDSTRTAFGEMHAIPDQDGSVGISPHKLGQDVIVEAHALAACDHLVHGNSSVSNFVLCKSPHMPHDYIFSHAQEALMTWTAEADTCPDIAEEMEQLLKRRVALRPGKAIRRRNL